MHHRMRRAVAGASGSPVISNGLTYINECTSLTIPTVFDDLDGGNSVSSQSGSLFTFQDGAFNAGNIAYRNNAGAYAPPVSTDFVVISYVMTIDNALGPESDDNNDIFLFNGITAITRLDVVLYSDKITVYNESGAPVAYTPTSLPPVGSEFTLTLAYKISTKTVDVYVDDEKILSDISAGSVYAFPGRMAFLKINRATSGYVDGSMSIDRVLVGDGLA